VNPERAQAVKHTSVTDTYYVDTTEFARGLGLPLPPPGETFSYKLGNLVFELSASPQWAADAGEIYGSDAGTGHRLGVTVKRYVPEPAREDFKVHQEMLRKYGNRDSR
jgi:hypothetical protein